MDTAANLTLLLGFLSALFLVLALISAAVEQILALLNRSHQRRRARPLPRRRSPRRMPAPAGGVRPRRSVPAATTRSAA